MHPSPVSVCIANYNGEHYLDETLASVVAQGDAIGETIVIDNGSTDRSIALIRERYPGVRIIALGRNAGLSAARNAGFQTARESRILFMDNDVALSPGCVQLLAAVLDAYPQAVAAMPAICHANDPGNVQYDGAGVHFLSQMILYDAGMSYATIAKRIRFIDSVVGACFLFDGSRWGAEPPADPALFIYLDDLDMGVRMRLRGHDVLSVPAATALHRQGTAGLSLRAQGIYAPLRVENLIANRWRILMKSYALRTLAVLGPVLLIYEAAQLLAVVKKGWWIPWLRAVRSVRRDFRSLMRRRREVQTKRKIADRVLLQTGPIPFTEHLAHGTAERWGMWILNWLARRYWLVVQEWL